MTFVELQNNVFRLMRDTAHTKYNQTFVKQWLNEAEKKYCQATDFSEMKDTSITTTSGTQEYDLPSDCKNVEATFYEGKPLKQVYLKDTIFPTSSTGTPTNYYIRNKKIGLFNIPGTTGDTITIIYYSFGGDMVNDTETPIIPEEHHLTLVWWACYMCSVEGDDTRADIFYNNYIHGLRDGIEEDMKKAFPEWPEAGETGRMKLDPLNHDV